MSTTTAPPVLTAQPSNSFGAGRVLMLVFGSLSLLVALGLLAGGGAAVWGLSQRDDSGYTQYAGPHSDRTQCHGAVTDRLTGFGERL